MRAAARQDFSNSGANWPQGEPTSVVYDGQCPFCSRYASLLRLREAVGPVRLVDARDGGSPEGRALVERLWAEGYDLDQGMAFVHEGRVFYGAEAVERLALLSTPSGLFNRLNGALLRHRRLADGLYPFLKTGRRLAITLRGAGRLRPPKSL